MSIYKELQKKHPEVTGKLIVTKNKDNKVIVSGHLNANNVEELKNDLISILLKQYKQIVSIAGVKFNEGFTVVEDEVVTTNHQDKNTAGAVNILYNGMFPVSAIKKDEKFKLFTQINFDKMDNAVIELRFIAPIILDSNLNIIDGNMRYDLAVNNNIQEVPVIIIDDNGIRLEKYTDDTSVAIAAMEYVYFARPDSNIAGVNVHTARKRTGRRLAIEQPAPDADMVIGVPNSSLSAASGYAEESGLPYEMGLIKNQYVARTFIQPTQELREQGVRMKLSAVKGVVSGKSIVLVDDSIVRGTTSKRIVQLLKEAGAREVHVRISAPPLIFPSFYGIDISTTEELIAANKTQDEICEIIGADSLGYLSEEGLIESIGLDYDAPYTGLCMDCFNGDYSAGLYDYEEDYLKSMTDIQKKFLKERGKNNE